MGRTATARPHTGRHPLGTTSVERVLVTDLDGTLLAGDEDSRRRLAHALDRHSHITVVYATGRSLASVRTLLAGEPLAPWPRWIIADVGASVIDTADMSHCEALEKVLRSGWPGRRRVRAALDRFPRLVGQDGVVQQGRCSYYLAPEDLSEEITAAVEAMGCTWTYSADRYFDVLPPRAGKGPALRALMHHLDWPDGHVLVAGDSLNDLSLFRLGTYGVVVGNAEPALVAHTATDRRLVHHPPLEGAAAILHTLEGLGWVQRPRQVVIGYHRPPWQHHQGRWQQPASPNGILPTLMSALGAGTEAELDAVWAAATTEPPSTAATIPTSLPLALLPLTAAQWAGYFHRACKETLWPALTGQPHLIHHEAAHWADYEAVNAAFARHISAHAQHGATVWLHDYNLWLVPALLKDHRPDLAVGLFHHTPFPDPRTFRTLPAAEQLRASLAQLDWAGFHTPAFARNFRTLLADAPRMPRIGIHPLGIDRHAVATLARSRPAAPQPDTPLILSVERLDYAKAPVHKIHALARLLDQQPGLRGRLRYRLVCPPPEPGIRAYDTTRTELERAIADLNARLGNRHWEPVEYIPRSLPFEEVCDHYLAADVFWVTSLADGMNLTAQEYLTAQTATGRTGVLILSRHAGAADYLGESALLTDPRSPHDLVDKLRLALAMPAEQRRAHTARLAALLNTTPPPAAWARTIIDAIGAAHEGSAQPGPISA